MIGEYGSKNGFKERKIRKQREKNFSFFVNSLYLMACSKGANETNGGSSFPVFLARLSLLKMFIWNSF